MRKLPVFSGRNRDGGGCDPERVKSSDAGFGDCEFRFISRCDRKLCKKHGFYQKCYQESPQLFYFWVHQMVLDIHHNHLEFLSNLQHKLDKVPKFHLEYIWNQYQVQQYNQKNIFDQYSFQNNSQKCLDKGLGFVLELQDRVLHILECLSKFHPT